jgi:hypothetical protein
VIGREVEGLERKHAEVGPALGMQEVMKQSWRASPESVEKWFQIQPTVAGRNKWARIEALQASASLPPAQRRLITAKNRQTQHHEQRRQHGSTDPNPNQRALGLGNHLPRRALHKSPQLQH